MCGHVGKVHGEEGAWGGSRMTRTRGERSGTRQPCPPARPLPAPRLRAHPWPRILSGHCQGQAGRAAPAGHAAAQRRRRRLHRLAAFPRWLVPHTKRWLWWRRVCVCVGGGVLSSRAHLFRKKTPVPKQERHKKGTRPSWGPGTAYSGRAMATVGTDRDPRALAPSTLLGRTPRPPCS